MCCTTTHLGKGDAALSRCIPLALVLRWHLAPLRTIKTYRRFYLSQEETSLSSCTSIGQGDFAPLWNPRPTLGGLDVRHRFRRWITTSISIAGLRARSVLGCVSSWELSRLDTTQLSLRFFNKGHSGKCVNVCLRSKVNIRDSLLFE